MPLNVFVSSLSCLFSRPVVLGGLCLVLLCPVRGVVWILIALQLATFLLCLRRGVWCVPVSADLAGVLLILLVVSLAVVMSLFLLVKFSCLGSGLVLLVNTLKGSWV